MHTCHPPISRCRLECASWWSLTDVAPHTFLLGHVSSLQSPPDHPCFATKKQFFKQHTAEIWKIAKMTIAALSSSDFERKPLHELNAQNSVPAQSIVCYFSYTFYCLLGNWFFFSVLYPPLNSLPLKKERMGKKLSAQDVWKEEQTIGIYNPMWMWIGLKL